MPTDSTRTPRLHDHLAAPLRLGEPDVHGPLAVFPIFGPAPQLDYVSFGQGHAAGVTIKELDHGASVNDLFVTNPTDRPVLLYEGEEVLGAQQNRTFDVSVLVGARSALQVPVSCVEAGRWDGARHGEEFTPAPHAAYPSLRSLKNRAARVNAVAGETPRAAQGEVWDDVARKSVRMNVASPTGAMHDIYADRRDRLSAFRGAIDLHDGQTGALVFVAGRPVVLDHVSRPDVYAALHGPLVEGYALDALEAGEQPAPVDRDRADTFMQVVLEARISEHDGIGLGRDVRFASLAATGTGLVAGDELVQLTAFPGDEPASACIRRPSRRRVA